MPVLCPKCLHEVLLGSLRCAACGADARAASGPPRVSLGDAIGHDVTAYMIGNEPRTYRRNVIIDRLAQLSPEFLTWARQPPASRGTPPPLELGVAAEVGALMAEYTSLLDEP